jgi:hypothetical protein
VLSSRWWPPSSSLASSRNRLAVRFLLSTPSQVAEVTRASLRGSRARSRWRRPREPSSKTSVDPKPAALPAGGGAKIPRGMCTPVASVPAASVPQPMPLICGIATPPAKPEKVPLHPHPPYEGKRPPRLPKTRFALQKSARGAFLFHGRRSLLRSRRGRFWPNLGRNPVAVPRTPRAEHSPALLITGHLRLSPGLLVPDRPNQYSGDLGRWANSYGPILNGFLIAR